MATGKITGIVKNVIDGTPIVGARVQVLTDIAILDTQTTDGTGSFTTGDITSGSYDILVSKDGYQTGHYLHIVVPDATLTLASLQLTPITYTTNLYGWNPITNTWDRLVANGRTLATSDSMDLAAIQGRYYVVNTGAVNVGANHLLVLLLNNPTGSSKIVRIARVLGGSSTDTIIQIVRNATFAAAGTPVTPRVTNFSDTDISIVTGKWITQASDPTTGGVIIYTYVQNGEPKEYVFDGRIAISAGNSIAIIATNNTHQVNPIAINVDWREDAE